MPSADSQLEGWAGCLQVCHFLLPRGLELSMNKASALPHVPPTFLSMASLDCLMAPFDLITPSGLLQALPNPPWENTSQLIPGDFQEMSCEEVQPPLGISQAAWTLSCQTVTPLARRRRQIYTSPSQAQSFPGGCASGEEPTCQCREMLRDMGSVPGSGRSAGGGHGNPLQYSCLENSRDSGPWQATYCP